MYTQVIGLQKQIYSDLRLKCNSSFLPIIMVVVLLLFIGLEGVSKLQEIVM